MRESLRKAREHEGMFGWQKLAHEKATALRIAESINLKSLDDLFRNHSVAELTETTEQSNGDV